MFISVSHSVIARRTKSDAAISGIVREIASPSFVYAAKELRLRSGRLAMTRGL